jgi:hypothetical protein
VARRWLAWGIVIAVLAAMAAATLTDRKVRIGRSVPSLTSAVAGAASDSTEADSTSKSDGEAR